MDFVCETFAERRNGKAKKKMRLIGSRSFFLVVYFLLNLESFSPSIEENKHNSRAQIMHDEYKGGIPFEYVYSCFTINEVRAGALALSETDLKRKRKNFAGMFVRKNIYIFMHQIRMVFDKILQLKVLWEV